MRPTIRVIVFAAGVCTIAGLVGPGPIGTARAQEEPSRAKSARGGALARVGPYQFEIFFYDTGLRVFSTEVGGMPLDALTLTGAATFYHPNSPQSWFVRPLHPAAAGPGQASESLDLSLDLSTVPPTGAKVAFEIADLPNEGEPTSRFTVPVEFIKTAAEPAAARPATMEVHGYAPIASEAHFFPLAGYYSTPIGVVWVPAPGLYHVIAPTQYYRPRAYRPPADWRLAHPAPSPGSPAVQSMPLNLSGIHTEYYWHPRAMDDRTSHEAWIRGQLREKYGQQYRY